jgi:hypothetical protein
LGKYFYLGAMTLNEAFEELIQSEAFRNKAKINDALGGKYRMYISRFNKGELKAGAIVEILLANGYEVKANKARKK